MKIENMYIPNVFQGYIYQLILTLWSFLKLAACRQRIDGLIGCSVFRHS